MKPHIIHRSLIALTLCTASPAQAEQLDDLLSSLRTFQADRAFDAAEQLEKAIVRAGNDSADRQRVVEKKLLESLASAETREAKILLCRLLQRVASEKSISPLSALLANAEAGHMARRVIAGIPGDAASAALRTALPGASPQLQIGLMNTLAQRRDAASLPLFVERMASPSVRLATIAIQSAGLLGSVEAVHALERIRTDGQGDPVRLAAIDDALLLAADGLLQAGERRAAREIYGQFFDAETARERIAGMSGLSRINDLQSRDLLDKALADPDETARRTALRLRVTMAGAGAARLMSELLPQISPDLQKAAIDWLGENGDAASREPVAAFLQAEDATLQAAALRALGGLGDAETVRPLLVRLSSETPAIREASRASLLRLQGAGVDQALCNALESADPTGPGDGISQSELIGILDARGSRAAYPTLLRIAREGSGDSRQAAFKALGNLASIEELPRLIGLLLETEMLAESKSVESAILGAFRQISDPQLRSKPLLAAYDTAPGFAKPALINLLGRAGSDEALAAVRAALRSSQSAERNAAVHTLARWPSPEPIEDLYEIASTSQDRSHRVVALRGYVSMAGSREDAPARYARALRLATTPEDKKLVLSGLGRTDSLEALKLCQSQLGEEAVATEAALACIQISRRAWRKSTDAVEALLKTFSDHPDEAVRTEAEKVLERIVR